MSYTDDEFITAWQQSGGSPAALANILSIDIRNVYKRRAALANKGKVLLTNPNSQTKGQDKTGAQMLAAPILARMITALTTVSLLFFQTLISGQTMIRP